MGLKFNDLVKQRTNGAYSIDVVGDSQLGTEAELFDGMGLGTIDMGLITNATMSAHTPEMLAFDLPFLYNDRKVMGEILDGDFMQKVTKIMYNNHGVKLLAYGESGYRSMLNNVRPIRKPQDLVGLKMRSMPSPIYIATFEAFGANAVPMAMSEVATALQQKTIDGYDNPISAAIGNRIYEFAKYYSLTRHIYTPHAITMSKIAFEKLSPENQKIFVHSALEAAKWQRELVRTQEEKFLVEIQASGTQVNDDVDVAAFRKAATPVYEKFRTQIGSVLLDELLALVNK
jgi:tripartite ATP-independent transporter DctP family solute receptor